MARLSKSWPSIWRSSCRTRRPGWNSATSIFWLETLFWVPVLIKYMVPVPVLIQHLYQSVLCAVLQSRSRMEPPLLGWSRSWFFCGPEPPFLRRLQLHLFGKQKRKALLLWQNMTKEQFIMVNVIQKRLAVIIHFLRAQNEKCWCVEPKPPGAAFFLPGAGVGANPIWSEPESSGTSDLRSRPKKWRLCKTGFVSLLYFISLFVIMINLEKRANHFSSLKGDTFPEIIYRYLTVLVNT